MPHIDNINDTSSWFLIVNPTSGNGRFLKQWNRIQDVLHTKEIHFSFAFTQYSKHELILVEEAIKQGYRKIISVGGDGTLHHVVNGIMTQRYTKTSNIKVGVIPLGTGNDWIKTYKIPNSIDFSIDIILQEYSYYQDIGCITLSSGESYYFNNIAGIGYDGYVVNKLKSLKKLGAIAYLLSGLYGLFFYKKSNYTIKVNDQIIKEKCLMVLVGLCQYSGGGMQMTEKTNPNDGLFDITIVKNFSFFDLILNLPKLYNGKIVQHKKVTTYKTNHIEIMDTKGESFIEGDGEIIGTGHFRVDIIPKAIQFIVTIF